jgi:SAM-dependent methyltransferase
VQARLAAERVREAGLSERVVCIEASFDDLPPVIPLADVAYAIESFAHAPAPERFFAECGRLVKPGGALVICDDFKRAAGGRRAERTIARFTRGWHLNSLLHSDHVRELAAAAGFVLESGGSRVSQRPSRDRVVDVADGAADRTPLIISRRPSSLRGEWLTGYELLFKRRQ